MAFSSIRGLVKPHNVKILLQSHQRTLKTVLDCDYVRPKPPKVDYLLLGSHLSSLMGDFTHNRLNENSKVFVTTGNVCSGKGQFAQKLAEYYDFMYHPDITDDDLFSYLCPDGSTIDLRGHNVILPEHAKYYTTELFWQDKNPPKHGKPMILQYGYFTHRFYKYLKGLVHLFNTGHGQMFDWDVFSDVIFAEAMLKSGLLSQYAYDWFQHVHNVTTQVLWRPHIIFYVKASNAQILERIKQRNLPWEMNSPTLNEKFLDTYQDCLETYLEKTSKYSEIVVIDRRDVDIYNDDDIRIIAEKLTGLDLEGKNFNRDEPKFIDWRLGLSMNMGKAQVRSRFSNSATSYEIPFGQFAAPLDMNEARYSTTAKEYQNFLLDRDPRFRYRHDANPLFQSKLSIMFNPFALYRNYYRDLPKEVMKRL